MVANLIVTDTGEQKVESTEELIFADGFGCITDIEFGPDGYLYVVSLSENTVYKVGLK